MIYTTALETKSKGMNHAPRSPSPSNPGRRHIRGNCWIPEHNTIAIRNPWEAESDTVPVWKRMNAYGIDSQAHDG